MRFAGPTALSFSSLYVVAVNELLVAQVELAVGNDRMRPDMALGGANRALWIEGKAPVFIPPFGRGLDEHHRSFSLLQAIEHTVRAGDRAFAELLFEPDLVPRGKLHAEPARRIAVPVEVVAHEDHAAVMVLH